MLEEKREYIRGIYHRLSSKIATRYDDGIRASWTLAELIAGGLLIFDAYIAIRRGIRDRREKS